MSKAQTEIDIRNRLRLDQASWTQLWRDAAAFCCPDRRQIVNNYASVNNLAFTKSPAPENSVAMDCVKVVSGGMKQWIIPEGWWQWQPVPTLSKSVQLRDWLADCTLRAAKPLAASGFYEATHEQFQDLVTFGTAGKLIMEGNNLPFRCTAQAPTEFVHMLNWDGEIERYSITYQKTAAELVEEFGSNVPDAVRNDMAQNKPNERHEVINSVYRRKPSEIKPSRYPDDPEGKPIESCWIHVTSAYEMRESAFDEMPLSVAIWDKWSNSSVYGASPAMVALADIKGLNVIDMIMGTLAELSINPRIMRNAIETGAIDLSPGGVTHVSGDGGVKEWATSGRFDVGDKMIERKEQSIRRIFHADLFQQISFLQREMTATEAQMREAEAVNKIAPCMSRLGTTDLGPAMQRVFMILYRQGHFAPPPDDAWYTDQAGNKYLLWPKLAQTNRMSRAINSKFTIAFNGIIGRALPLAQAGRPELLDNYDFDTILRDLDRGDGVPTEWHIDPDKVEALRAARAQQQMQAKAQDAALQAIASKPAEMAGLAAQMGGQQAPGGLPPP